MIGHGGGRGYSKAMDVYAEYGLLVWGSANGELLGVLLLLRHVVGVY